MSFSVRLLRRGAVALAARRRQYSSDGWSFRGMDIEFLGTGSCTPTAFRNVACTALRMEKQDWLFDCGEGTQLQVHRSNSITSAKINRICVTHRHGDHVYGLPSLLQTVAGDSSEATVALVGDEGGPNRDIELIGPPGTAAYVVASLAFSGAKLKSRVVIVELSNEATPLHRVAHNVFTRSHAPNGAGVWELGAADGVPTGATLFAGRIRHTVPCWGYLVVEPDVPGTIDADKLTALGVPPSPLYKQLKAGSSLLLKDGTVVKPEDVMGAPSRGRRVAILGDTDSALQSLQLFRGVDVLVHDCTLPPEFEDSKSRHVGHSGPRIAGEFARAVGAGHLFLSHIGRRVGWQRGSSEPLKRAAERAFGSKNVTVASDFDVFSINQPAEFAKHGVVSQRATRANLVSHEADETT